MHNKLISRYTLLLIPAGIMLNIGLAQLALKLELLLFLDSIGTILAAALGGYLPGIIVGFFSNAINGISDPITLYYGIISIMIAMAAAFFSERGAYKRLNGVLSAALVFALIGGGIGSVLTWLLYGFGFGTGISAPLAELIYQRLGLSVFTSQFTADMLIDILDKLVSVSIASVVIYALPDPLLAKLPYGCIYQRKGLYAGSSDLHIKHAGLSFKSSYRTLSLRVKVVVMITVTAFALGLVSLYISVSLYKSTMNEQYINTCNSTVDLMLKALDADSVEGYLQNGENTPGYLETELTFESIRESMADIEYMYVYQIKPDGCHVVFDVDTPELPGESVGALVPHEAEFADYMNDLLAGREIEPVISSGAYGWLLTVYKPVINSEGRCVAYAAADIRMDQVITDRYVYVIRMISLLFGVSIIIIMFAVWFAERWMITPINSMAAAASEFAYDSEEERLKSTRHIRDLNIKTGDEIENLYCALSKTVTDVAAYITDINEKAQLITQMQNNIIISFATMVENRDVNTGEHIKHTSIYVRTIANSLKENPKYGSVMTNGYIDSIERSAPLHDIGKIKIPDAILNKPGRLTPSEFDEIKTHTTAGRDILDDAMQNISDPEYMHHAREMALYHHERWDGTGYPEGLSGEAIPLSARIMAVADVFDALISRRSYKEPMSFEQALEIITQEAGSHFDPDVVEAFLRAANDVRKITGK